MKRRGRVAWGLVTGVLLFFPAAPAHSFTHIVKPGETLAQIAARVYGNPKLETVLVDANALDVAGGAAIVPGLPLHVPAPGHHTVQKGETWYTLALAWLGDTRRADSLAKWNHGEAWIPPVEGQEIVIPAVVTHIAGDNETVNMLWDRYNEDPGLAWMLNNYNFRGGTIPVHHAEVILIPLPQLSLTDAGKAEAQAALERAGGEAAGVTLEVQRRAEEDLPALRDELNAGKYAAVVARGSRWIGTGVLTKPQLATIWRALLESFVALDATSEAIAACAEWRNNDPEATLDPVYVSPKILSACGAL